MSKLLRIILQMTYLHNNVFPNNLIRRFNCYLFKCKTIYVICLCIVKNLFYWVMPRGVSVDDYMTIVLTDTNEYSMVLRLTILQLFSTKTMTSKTFFHFIVGLLHAKGFCRAFVAILFIPMSVLITTSGHLSSLEGLCE